MEIVYVVTHQITAPILAKYTQPLRPRRAECVYTCSTQPSYASTLTQMESLGNLADPELSLVRKNDYQTPPQVPIFCFQKMQM